MVVETELKKLGLNPVNVQLGEVILNENEIGSEAIEQLRTNLNLFGFELLTDKKEQQISLLKSAIIELVHYSKGTKLNLSEYLSEKLDLDYPYLSALFSAQEGTTIEKYYLSQRIEKVKELLTYGEKSLSEIAYELNYSSVAHLSSQFKKVSGQTPSDYKNNIKSSRRVLDDI